MLTWSPTPPETEIFKDTIPPRFIRGLEKEGQEATEKRWNETKQWRQEEGIDTIIDEPQPNYETIKLHYQHAYCGRSKDGRIVYYERPGLSNIAKMKELGLNAQTQTRHFLFITECCWRVLSPDQDSTLITIYDMKNVGLSDVAGDKLELFKAISKVYQAHYVERSGTICIINTAMWFRMAWKIVSPFIHENTRAKIKICGGASDYEPILRELIDVGNLAKEYGGEGPSMMESAEEQLILEHVRAMAKK